MYRKRLIYLIIELFFIAIFVFFATSIVDARAGGGHRFSGGSSSRGYSSSRSSSRSYSSGYSSSRSSSRSYSSKYSSSSYSSSSSSSSGLDFGLPFLSNLSIKGILLLILAHLVFSFLVAKCFFCDISDTAELIGCTIAIAVLFCPLYMVSWTLIPFIIFYIFKEKKNNNNADYSFKEVSDYSSITYKDPSFNKDKFLERAKKAFLIVQESWSNRDLSKAESFLADGTYEQFQIQINTMKANHEIDLMKEINIKKASIVRLSSNAGYDSLNVLFTVKAVNYRIDDRDNSFKNGSKSAEEFSEVWTFMRRRGSKTVNNGLIEGYCPNCGAKIEGARLSKCPSCSSLLRSGQHDWILAGITQASEWRDTIISNPIAYKSMISVDNSLNIPHLEDKLTVIFWRLIEANRLGNAEPIQKVSTNEFAQSYANSNYSLAFPKCKECALGSQEVIGFITNRPDYNYLIGQLVWSGISISKNEEVFNKTMFVLRRKKGVTSDSSKCFCSTHCPNCGAPEPNDLSSNTCEYCNSAFNDDSKDWMLSDVVIDFYNKNAYAYMIDARRSAKGLDSKSESSNEQNYTNNTEENINNNSFDYFSGTDLLNLTVAMMLADGVIDNREMNIIHNIRKARNISNNELKQIIGRLQKATDPIKFVLETTAIKLDENLIKLLVSIAAADNKIEDSELRVLQKVAEKMGLSEKRLRDLINEVYEMNWN